MISVLFALDGKSSFIKSSDFWCTWVCSQCLWAPCAALWPLLDRLKGHILQVLFSSCSSLQQTSYVSCHSPKLSMTYSHKIPSPNLSSLLNTFQFKIRSMLLNTCLYWHPAWNKMSIFILWAEFISSMCYIQFRCVSVFSFFFFPQWQMRWKVRTSKRDLQKAPAQLSSTVVSELNRTARRDAISKSGRFRLSQNGDILCRTSLW